MGHAVSSLSGRVLSALALLVLCVAGPAAAQWAWKDDNGRVVYSDRPPPATIKSDKIVRQPPHSQTALPGATAAADEAARAGSDGKAAAAPAAPAAQKSTAEREMEFRKRQQERADAEKKAQDEQSRTAARAAECERAKGYLKALEEGHRVARTDASGNREFIDDAQRASEAERTRKMMQTSCGS